MTPETITLITHMHAGGTSDAATRCGLEGDDVEWKSVSILAQATTCDACLAVLDTEGAPTERGVREHWRVTHEREGGERSIVEFPNVHPHYPPALEELEMLVLAPGCRMWVERYERESA